VRRRRAEPLIPVQMARDRIRAGGSHHALGPPAEGAVRPGVDLLHRANAIGMDEVVQMPPCVASMALVPHLGREVGMVRCGPGQAASLPGGMGERLLGVAVQARLHGEDRRRIVVMVGRADHHAVDVLGLFLQQLTVVDISPRVRPVVRRVAPCVLIDVAVARTLHAQSHHLADVGPRDAARGDECDAQIRELVLLGLRPSREEQWRGPSHDRHLLEEISTCAACAHGALLFSQSWPRPMWHRQRAHLSVFVPDTLQLRRRDLACLPHAMALTWAR